MAWCLSKLPVWTFFCRLFMHYSNMRILHNCLSLFVFCSWQAQASSDLLWFTSWRDCFKMTWLDIYKWSWYVVPCSNSLQVQSTRRGWEGCKTSIPWCNWWCEWEERQNFPFKGASSSTGGRRSSNYEGRDAGKGHVDSCTNGWCPLHLEHSYFLSSIHVVLFSTDVY